MNKPTIEEIRDGDLSVFLKTNPDEAYYVIPQDTLLHIFRTTLQSERDRAEEEKREFLQDVLALRDESLANAEDPMDVDTRYYKMRALLRNAMLDEIQNIAFKHNITLTNPQDKQ